MTEEVVATLRFERVLSIDFGGEEDICYPKRQGQVYADGWCCKVLISCGIIELNLLCNVAFTYNKFIRGSSRIMENKRWKT